MEPKMFTVLWMYCFVLCWVGSDGQASSATCLQQETCGACIRTEKCIWCANPIVPKSSKKGESMTRCISIEHRTDAWCPADHVVSLESRMEILESRDLTEAKGDEAIQIRPQRVSLLLRLGESKSISIEYKQAVDYPVDLYYLMDLSASMADDRDKLLGLSDSLSIAMKKITNNFRMGFGSFVDKPEMPYVNTKPSKLKSPCKLPGGRACAPPYSYKNQMPLSTDTNLFRSEIKNAPVSGNMDYPEGGFDALMQVIVCKEKIGWRPKARKLIIFTTDAAFHLAGDGKLAGIVEPNDEQCHLDENGFYNFSLLTDYPSIAQLDKQTRENNVNVIFAVVAKQEKVYKVLKDRIYGSSSSVLSTDSANIVDIIKGEYDKLVDSVTLTDDSGGSVEIEYYTTCLGQELKKKNECGGLRGRPKIEFTAVVKAVSCPQDRKKWKQIIEIKPGALNESLKIELEIICDCPCERDGEKGFEGKSPFCNASGSLQCGVCACADGRYGRFCECDSDAARTDDSGAGSCRANNTDRECSGFGTCKCGKCECELRPDPKEIYYGTYCECNNFSCDRNGGSLCSGPERGRCHCGKCICESGWSGRTCECRNTNATCIAPDSEEVCSGHGSCECGACLCSLMDEFRYSGRYCEECPNCQSQRCSELLPCVECQTHGSGIYDESECKIKCTAFQSEIVDKIDMVDKTSESTERICREPDTAGCTTVFKYKYEDDNLTLKVQSQKHKECPEHINVLAIIAIVVGSTVLAGLIALVIWKLLTNFHDSREYSKFETERQLAKWDRGDNPLYKPSTSTFRNPTFQKR